MSWKKMLMAVAAVAVVAGAFAPTEASARGRGEAVTGTAARVLDWV